MSNIDNIKDHFLLPISYCKEKTILKENIIDDLELVKTVDPSNNSIYTYFFSKQDKEKDILVENVVHQISSVYTTDTKFLKETQTLLKTYKPITPTNTTKILEVWKEIKDDTGFKEKYNYMDWGMLEHLNYSDTFLQILSVYTMASPVLSLLTPIIILIIPFFILKLKGLPISVGDYMDIIKHIVANHALGKLTQIFTNFNSISMEQKLYILFSAGFYIFSIYQNIMTCIKFHQNMMKIHKFFEVTKDYLEETISKMNDFLSATQGFASYETFNSTMKNHIYNLENFQKKINVVGKYTFSLSKLMGIGVILKNFYEYYENPSLNNAFLYSFGFHGYYSCLDGLITNIRNKHLHFIKFSKKKGKNVFRDSYYCPLLNKNAVKNTISLKENMIITGPNASGKTTILKTTLINILLSQQFGCGCYKSGILYPYFNIHCYLNIPDTSGRDSLFQSEVRRCKDILKLIMENSDETHFCVFDELYSGTNPEEAITSSTAFMEYLVKYKNVQCMLTTHFIKVCHNLDKNAKIGNFHMDVHGDNQWKYTYSLKPGISEVKGGLKVLYDMEYPKEILDNIHKKNNSK
jgi:hypothetical protein